MLYIKRDIFQQPSQAVLPDQEVEYAGHTEKCEFLEQRQAKDAENVETGLWQSVQPNFPWKSTLSSYHSKLE